MKQEQWTTTPEGAPTSALARGGAHPARGARRADVAMVAPKLTKLVTTKIIAPKTVTKDAKTLERERLLAALLAAKARPDITRATEAFYAAGHALDLRDQEPHLQILEHEDEARVRAAMESLGAIFQTEAPKHRPLLEQRLARIEQLAEEPATRQAASSLRRKISALASHRPL